MTLKVSFSVVFVCLLLLPVLTLSIGLRPVSAWYPLLEVNVTTPEYLATFGPMYGSAICDHVLYTRPGASRFTATTLNFDTGRRVPYATLDVKLVDTSIYGMVTVDAFSAETDEYGEFVWTWNFRDEGIWIVHVAGSKEGYQGLSEVHGTLYADCDFLVDAHQSNRVPKTVTTTTRTPSTPSSGAIDAELIFDNTNSGRVYNDATSPTVFTLSESRVIMLIRTYHWNDGQGTVGPGSIALRAICNTQYFATQIATPNCDQNGKLYGPWSASGESGSGGVPNAYWVVEPNVELPAGSYTVEDSDPSTWAQNEYTGGAGMVWVYATRTLMMQTENPMQGQIPGGYPSVLGIVGAVAVGSFLLGRRSVGKKSEGKEVTLASPTKDLKT